MQSTTSTSTSEGEQPIEILLIGFGAVGVIYAYILEKSVRCRVTAVVRSLYNTISTNGIRIRSEKFGKIDSWRPHRLKASIEEAADQRYRFIICSFKCLPDVNPTSSILAPLMVPYSQNSNDTNYEIYSPTVVLLQNGIGIEQPIAEAFPSINIISCVVWIGANLINPSTSDQSSSSSSSQLQAPTVVHGMMEKLVFGLYQGEGFAPIYGDEESTPKSCNQFVEGILSEDLTPLVGESREKRIRNGKKEVELLSNLLRAGGGETEVLDHIQPARWAKNFWNGAFSTMCALSRSPVSSLAAPEVLPYTLPVVRRTMLEILYVARALGYRESDLPAQSVDDAIKLTIDNYQIKSKRPKFEKSSKVSLEEEANLKGDVFEDDDEEEEELEGDDKEEIKDGSVTATFKPSMLIDLEDGRPMELEPIVGAVLDRARSKAIETPRLDLIYSALKISQSKAVKAYANRLKTQEQERHSQKWAMRKPSVSGSGTSGRQAWLDQVQRLVRLDDRQGKDVDGQTAVGGSTVSSRRTSLVNGNLPSRDAKVTGKPLTSRKLEP
ncbi:ketopantoate reductase PanE/ApbA C terminal-domain-containing protein [Phakopsora pachyrhizi]|uniref:Ketopantoate reductase PanE/ApbA C terminal-domain-containing protein n=1 Tax=Phakopsora pachyrhizi TaxID=170000 RepID=A0AAV0B5Q8_PHAPC|nr:ketopantoate reductase PanE/ApbA C terminal-domain-containing protein [Phakopsora pachyrhizi]